MARSNNTRSGFPLGLLGACLIGLGVVPTAWASVADNITVSPVAMAMGNAVTADPPDLASIHFNPAGLARMSGNWKYDGLTFVSIRTHESYTAAPDLDIGGFKAKDDPVAGTSSSPVISQRVYVPGYGLAPWHLPMAIAPSLGFAFNKEGSPFTFGTTQYLSFGMSLDRTSDPDNPSRFQGSIVEMQRLVLLAPAVGYKVSDTFRVGVSVPIAHHAILIDTDMRMPNKLLGMIGTLQKAWCPGGSSNVIDVFTFGLCGGGKEGQLNPFGKAANLRLEMTAPIDPTLNLGALWEPTSWFALGGVYQGGSNTVYHGTFQVTTEPMLRQFVYGMNASLFGPIIAAITGMPSVIPKVQTGNLVATIPFPERWQFGVKVKPLSFLQFNADVSYANWAKWDKFTFKFDQSLGLLEMGRLFAVGNPDQLTMNMGLKNVVNYGLGMQVQVNKKLALRVGYEPRKSSIPLDKISVLAPLPDTKLKSLGLQLKLDHGAEINVGASYMTGNYAVPARTDCNMNCDNLLNIVYNPYAGLNVAGDIAIRYLGVSLLKPF